MPTFNGTNNADTMNYSNYSYGPPAGWPEDQQWLQLNALAGNDTVYGSQYADSIEAGDGDDLVYGNDGKDSIKGGNGNDRLYGGQGDDYLKGDAGNDTLYGGNGKDTLQGDAGNDIMYGGNDADTFFGGIGNDVMRGEAGDDIFFAEEGDDYMDGGAGNDRLWGGSGNDSYRFDGNGIDYVNDAYHNGGEVRGDKTYDTADRIIVTYQDSDVEFWRLDGDSLLITSAADMADGVLDNGVILEGYFKGGHYTIEHLQTANNTYYLPAMFPVAA